MSGPRFLGWEHPFQTMSWLRACSLQKGRATIGQPAHCSPENELLLKKTQPLECTGLRFRGSDWCYMWILGSGKTHRPNSVEGGPLHARLLFCGHHCLTLSGRKVGQRSVKHLFSSHHTSSCSRNMGREAAWIPPFSCSTFNQNSERQNIGLDNTGY